MSKVIVEFSGMVEYEEAVLQSRHVIDSLVNRGVISTLSAQKIIHNFEISFFDKLVSINLNTEGANINTNNFEGDVD